MGTPHFHPNPCPAAPMCARWLLGLCAHAAAAAAMVPHVPSAAIRSASPLPSAPSAPHARWQGYFDGVFCINLQQATERRAHVGRVDRDPGNSERGCFNSHLSVIRYAHEQGLQNVVIFEDDVNVFRPTELDSFNSAMQQVVDFLSTDQTWELFYLGHIQNLGYLYRTPMRPLPGSSGGCSGSSYIYEVQDALGGHAYVLSRRGMEKVLHESYCGEGVDFMLSSRLRCHARYPMMFYGDNSFESSISHTDIPSVGDQIGQAVMRATAVVPWACVLEDLNRYNVVQVYFAALIANLVAGAVLPAAWLVTLAVKLLPLSP